MLSQLALQMFDVSGPGFSVPAHSFAQSAEVADGCAMHVLLAAKAMSDTFVGGSPRSLVLARGMPYPENVDAAFELAKLTNITPARVVSLGNQCAAVIDGLSLAINFANTGLSPVALIAADEFSTFGIGAERSEFSQWRNMAACLRIESGGRFRLRAIASISDPALSSMTTVNVGHLHLDKVLAASLREVDVDAQVGTIDALLGFAVPRFGIPFLCVTNRSSGRLSALAGRMGERVHLIESRRIYGHTGGADILLNLITALHRIGHSGANIICSANGLGYIWSSALFEIAPENG